MTRTSAIARHHAGTEFILLFAPGSPHVLIKLIWCYDAIIGFYRLAVGSRRPCSISTSAR